MFSGLKLWDATMNKKLGNVITAVIIGLAMLWLSQKVFAQAPITEIYAESAIFYCASNDWGTVATDTYATGSADGNYAGWLKGDPVGGCYNGTMYAILDFGDTYTVTDIGVLAGGTISARMPDQHICANADCWDNRTSAFWTDAPGDDWYSVGDLAWHTMSVAEEDPAIPVRYLMVQVDGETNDADGVYLNVDAARLVLETPINPGGGDDCATVTDADFDGLPTYDNGGWNVAPDNVSIHDGYLDISTAYGEGNTWQVFTPTHRTYTATVKARSASTQTTTAGFAILNANMDGDFIVFSVTQTISDDFGTYDFPLSNSLSPGDGAYLYIQADMPGLQVDYICLTPDVGVCADPSEREYVYITDPNEWADGLNLWTPLEIDENLSTPELSEIIGAPEGGPQGGYKQSFFLTSPFDIIKILLDIFHLSSEAVTQVQNTVENGGKADSIVLKMPNEAMLQSMEIDFVSVFALNGVNFTVLALDNGEWVDVGVFNSDLNQQIVNGETGTAVIQLRPVDSPTQYAIISTISADVFDIFSGMFITKISTYGCYSGDAYTGECIVSDPTLDGGDDGGPDPYYWHVLNGALSVPGGVSLSAENKGYISQNVFTPAPGAYELTVELINDTSDRCELYARGAGDTGYILDDFFNVLLPCSTGVSIQTVTVDVMLPDDQFNFILSANRGHATVTNICFSLPGSDVCINQNPDFTDGSTGYEGGFTVENGHIILNPGTNLYAFPAVQTPFYSGNGPWVLEVTASSAITGDTVLSAITPGLNPVDSTLEANDYYPISTTQTLTYAITLTDKDKKALTFTGNGPSVYNNDADGRLWLSRYCLMTDTGSTWWGNKDCTTVTNPDFKLGLTGWTSANVVPSINDFVVFDTNGYVKQTVNTDNLIANGHFDTGVSGWATSWGDTIASGSGYSGAGLSVTSAGAAGHGVRYDVSVSTNTNYTFFVRVKADSTITGTVNINIYNTSFTPLGTAAPVTKDNEWHTYTVTANSGANSTLRLVIVNGTAQANGQVILLDDAAIVAGSTIPVQYTDPQEATVHWIAKSGVPSEITATVSVSSTAGVFTTTQVVGPAIGEFFTPFEVGGDVEVRVQGTTAGLELDFVCLNSGTYTEGPDDGDGPGTWTPGVGDGRCAPPPMVVMTNTLQSWLPSIWIWSTQPNNYELVGAYSAAWLRYIGCTLTDLQKMLEVKLNIIIAKLGAGTGTNWADMIARIFEAIAKIIDAIAGLISQLLTLLITIWNSLAPGLGLVWQLMGTILELLEMIIRLLAEFAGWLLQMMMTFTQIVFNFMLDSATVPGEMLTAYNNAVNDPAYDIIPLSSAPSGEMGARTIDIDCSVPESNYWCGILFGFQVVNQTLGASILYPMVIIGLIVSTIFVFRNQLWEYYNVKTK